MNLGMKDRICVITGATDGIGWMSALGVARTGARVIIVGRNPSKAEERVGRLARETGNEAVEHEVADLSVQAEVRALAERLGRTLPRIDVLVNNVRCALCQAYAERRRHRDDVGAEPPLPVPADRSRARPGQGVGPGAHRDRELGRPSRSTGEFRRPAARRGLPGLARLPAVEARQPAVYPRTRAPAGSGPGHGELPAPGLRGQPVSATTTRGSRRRRWPWPRPSSPSARRRAPIPSSTSPPTRELPGSPASTSSAGNRRKRRGSPGTPTPGVPCGTSARQ